MDRRQFIAAAGVAGAALGVPSTLRGAAPPAGAGRDAIWLDLQGDVDGFDEKDGKPGAILTEAARRGWISAVSQTVCDVGNGPDRFAAAVKYIAETDRLIADNPTLLAKIESVADLRAAKAAGKIGIIYNFQDTTPLEGDLSRIATFKELGLRILQLTYNKRNLAGDGCLEPANAGLSDFGRQVIAEIHANNLLLDLSHSCARTIAEGIAESKAPPAITHSGCRDLVDFPRNTYDSEIRALANKGGVIGIYLMPFLRAKGQAVQDDLLRHLDHAVNVAGEDHVGIGTDNGLLGYEINDQTRRKQREFYESRVKAGIAAPGEAADVFNMVEGYNDAARFANIARDLSLRGWSSTRIDKVLGGNFLRLFKEVWKA
jgi:membrane dipeptidase